MSETGKNRGRLCGQRLVIGGVGESRVPAPVVVGEGGEWEKPWEAGTATGSLAIYVQPTFDAIAAAAVALDLARQH